MKPRVTSEFSVNMFEGKYTTDHYNNILGKGSHGHVIKVTDVGTQAIYALKAVIIENDYQYVLREVLNQCKIQSEFVVKVVNYLVKDNVLAIVLEYCEEGDLGLFLSNKRLEIEWRERVRIMWQIGQGMKAVWDNGIIHRDLKPANILITRNGAHEIIAKIADFDSSKIHSTDSIHTMGIGTRKYMAKEVASKEEGRHYDQRADIWSLGILFFKIMDREWPDNVAYSEIPSILAESKIPGGFKELLSHMIVENPEQRIQPKEFLNCLDFLKYDIGLEIYRRNETIVYNAVNLVDNTPVIFKCKKIVPGDTSCHEIEMHKRVQHEFIVRFIEELSIDNYAILVMERCEGGTLEEFLRGKGPVSERKAWIWMLQLAQAVSYLHSKQIAHRDLKPDNILLQKAEFEGKIKLGNFSTAILSEDMDSTEKSLAPLSRSPEVHFHKPHDNFAQDSWGLGCTFYRLLIGSDFLQVNSLNEISEALQRPPSFPSFISSAGKSLISALLEQDSARRLPVRDISSHPFFAAKPADISKIREAGEWVRGGAGNCDIYYGNAAIVIANVIQFACDMEEEGKMEWSYGGMELARKCIQQGLNRKPPPPLNLSNQLSSLLSLLPSNDPLSWEYLYDISQKAYSTTPHDISELSIAFEAMKLMWKAAQVIGVKGDKAMGYQRLFQSLYGKKERIRSHGVG